MSANYSSAILLTGNLVNLILHEHQDEKFMRVYPEDNPELANSSNSTNYCTHHAPYFRENDWLQYTLRFSWLHLLSSPLPVCQGCLPLPGGVQPPFGGHQSLQSTVVSHQSTVNVCQCIVGKDKCIASCQMLVNICSTWRMSTNTSTQTLFYLVGKHTM